MYSSCLFCRAPFGANDALEHFSLGRRIAFDSARGRLWVICRPCQQWNLAPLEQRWEAVEECEKLFRASPFRASADQISLTRIRSDLELVRIGDPPPSEMAVWRYGDQFGRRRKRRLLLASLGTGAVSLSLIGGIALGAGLGGLAYIGVYWRHVFQPDADSIVARVPMEEGNCARVAGSDLRYVRLLPARHGRPWQFEISEAELLQGNFAIHAAGLVLPHLNRFGGTRRCVEDAVRFLERHRTAEAAFTAVADGAAQLAALPNHIRLALEMAAHEEVEREALDGELTLLQRSWREAEEIAAIADRLIIPAGVERLLERLKADARREAPE